MIGAIRTVAWKEWKALSDQAGVRGFGGISMLIAIGLVMGVVMPWIAGPGFLSSPLILFLYPFMGISAASSPIVDSFAGEKERRTLETLLAGPLDDRSILLGKMWVGFAAGVATAGALALCAVLTLNVREWGAGVVLPPLWAIVGVTLMTLAAVGFVCTAGILASMRCSTVRQAGQRFGYFMFGVFMIPVAVTVLVPESVRAFAREWVPRQDPVVLVGSVAGALVALDLICFRLAFRAFRRGRLAVD